MFVFIFFYSNIQVERRVLNPKKKKSLCCQQESNQSPKRSSAKNRKNGHEKGASLSSDRDTGKPDGKVSKPHKNLQQLSVKKNIIEIFVIFSAGKMIEMRKNATRMVRETENVIAGVEAIREGTMTVITRRNTKIRINTTKEIVKTSGAELIGKNEFCNNPFD